MLEAEWMGDSLRRHITDEVSTASSGSLATWQHQQPLMGDARFVPCGYRTALRSSFLSCPGGCMEDELEQLFGTSQEFLSHRAQSDDVPAKQLDMLLPMKVCTGFSAAQPLPVQPEPSAVLTPAVAPEGSSNSTSRLLQTGETTVMIKHVPAAYSQRKLLREFTSAGFQGLVDFIYLPMDARTRANRGFAFCNLLNSTAAMRFCDAFHGGKLQLSEDDSPALEVNAAQIQGFEENAKHFLRTKATKGRDSYSRPLFLRALPPGVKLQMNSAGCKSRPANANANTNVQPVANQHRAAKTASVASDPEARQQSSSWMSAGGADQMRPQCQSCGRTRLPGFTFCPFCGQAPEVFSFWI
eukprot:TRINITY_DN910_c0_g2_i3.p1 TRINITY_DN910_c0_g2~~TRINITY_DN910_c0_g2_i3.p1  ORF type:complete len:355 (+),score=71.41 TRINITY_DN910_c0_g2_i3:122-1186(+)